MIIKYMKQLLWKIHHQLKAGESKSRQKELLAAILKRRGINKKDQEFFFHPPHPSGIKLTDIGVKKLEINRLVSLIKQAKNTGRNWYVIHTYSGYEDAVREALLQRIESMNMQDKIFDVVVPKETQIVMKKGQPKAEKKRLFPGYVLVDMTVDDDSWYVVRNTPNVTGFVGSGTIPVPVSEEEWGIVRRHMGESDPKFKIDLQENDPVMVLDGPFANYDGVVKSVDNEKGKVKVLITIFGRETPVELDFTQIKKK